jgi:hypothetical protein
MKAYGRVQGKLQHSASALAGKWPASRPGPLYPLGKSSGTYWVGGWVDLEVSLDALEKREMLLLPGIELGPPSPTVGVSVHELLACPEHRVVLLFRCVWALCDAIELEAPRFDHPLLERTGKEAVLT